MANTKLPDCGQPLMTSRRKEDAMDGNVYLGRSKALRLLRGLALTAAIWIGGLPLPASASEGNAALALQPEDGMPDRQSSVQSAYAKPGGKEQTAAAFIREGALWVKEKGEERRLSPNGAFARNPAWSPDGRSIAYNQGEEQRQLWVVDVRNGNSHLAAPEGGTRFEWSPAKNRIAYLQEEKLYTVGQDAGDEPVEVAGEIGNFSWLPDGSGFLVSSAAQLLPEGWTPVRISRIMLPTETSDPLQEEPLYVLPKQIEDMIVVGTSKFRWSADGEWAAFLATPTASLSADGNMLCVLSADGKTFITLDAMARNEQWFQWSPKPGRGGNRLAYIAGVGREASSNKRLTVTPVPTTNKKAYTPAGFVDQNFAWYGEDAILVSRAKEGAWSTNPGERPWPELALIGLSGGRQRVIAKPPGGSGDFQPTALCADSIGWVRSNRSSASDVMVAISAKEAGKATAWIKGIDLGDNFYEQWNWNPVVRFYVKEP
ncbi:dipeptidyl aminopeptidase/acylaminoacyl peptidase [Paenibacillus sacheonensis]|nr:dipeptidyl aminopeptidase/acylaminoacyl peptidase [Paenibacillus sacheonensis]